MIGHPRVYLLGNWHAVTTWCWLRGRQPAGTCGVDIVYCILNPAFLLHHFGDWNIYSTEKLPLKWIIFCCFPTCLKTDHDI